MAVVSFSFSGATKQLFLDADGTSMVAVPQSAVEIDLTYLPTFINVAGAVKTLFENADTITPISIPAGLVGAPVVSGAALLVRCCAS